MNQRRVLLVVEGPHDEAFISKILRERHGIQSRSKYSAVDDYWRKTIPYKVPHDDDLRQRMPVPFFYESPGLSLAIVVAVGESRLVEMVGDTLAVLPAPPVDAIGVILDADDQRTAESRHNSICRELSKLSLMPGGAPGTVGMTPPYCGVYVLPDNTSKGTLEDVLLECAELNYNSALRNARDFIGLVKREDYRSSDLKELNKPAGRNKAIIAAITAVLKPGKTAQTSISDNYWLDNEAYSLISVRNLELFLEQLIAGPPANIAPNVSPPAETTASNTDLDDGPAGGDG